MEDHRVCLQESLVSRNAVRKATNLGDETLLRSIRARIKGAERERERPFTGSTAGAHGRDAYCRGDMPITLMLWVNYSPLVSNSTVYLNS